METGSANPNNSGAPQGLVGRVGCAGGGSDRKRADNSKRTVNAFCVRKALRECFTWHGASRGRLALSGAGSISWSQQGILTSVLGIELAPESNEEIVDQKTLQDLFFYQDGKLIFRRSTGSRKAGDSLGSACAGDYVRARVLGKSYLAHRLIWIYHHGNIVHQIDHINGNGLDNHIENLRDIPQAENQQNLRKPKITSKSGILGVNWHKKTKKWRVQLRLNGATIHVGYFHCIEKASAAYIAKKRELHPACTI